MLGNLSFDINETQKINYLVKNITFFFFVKLGLKLLSIYKRSIMSYSLCLIFHWDWPIKCFNTLTVFGLYEAVFKKFLQGWIRIRKQPAHIIQTVYKARDLCFSAL